MHEYYSISELTKEFGVTTRTLRYYEDEGLLVPFRRGRTRLYTQVDRHRLQQIMRAKRLNFSLAEIAQLLTMSGAPPEDEGRVQQMIAVIKHKREELRQMRRDIDESLHELERIEETCFERLAELDVNR
ncbi:MerR family transcriptional regulator [Bartonella sp. LJL80]